MTADDSGKFFTVWEMNVKSSVRKNSLRRQRVVIARSDQKIERAKEASLGRRSRSAVRVRN